jgi:glycine betaine/choline ABC-type transport system substrate-binding protein
MAGVRIAPACLLALLAAAALAACGKEDGDPHPPARPRPAVAERVEPIPREAANAARPPIVVGAMNFPEQVLLGRLYAGALRAAGYRVRLRLDLGSDEIALRALRSGRIDAFPAYLSSALAGLRAGVLRRPREAYARARAAFAKRELTALAPTPFENAPAFAVRRSTARRLGDTRLSALRARAARLTLAGPLGCRRRLDCALGLRRVYGLRFRRVVEVPLARRHAVLRGRRAHVSAVFSTDGALAHGDLVLLRDDRDLIPPYPVTFVVRDAALRAGGPGVRDAVARLQATLTTARMQRLNARLARGVPAFRAAATHLRRTGLVR